jgi:hypothetical protein
VDTKHIHMFLLPETLVGLIFFFWMELVVEEVFVVFVVPLPVFVLVVIGLVLLMNSKSLMTLFYNI